MSSVLMGIALALRALVRNRLRAALTILGLLIGVAAVVMVAGLASGARAFIKERLDTLGSNVLIIAPQPVGSGFRDATTSRLTEDDARAIGRDVATVDAVSPVIEGRSVVAYGERSITTNVLGTLSTIFVVSKWPMAKGELWTANEEISKAKVCVIGTTVQRQLFGNEDPVGRTIRIGRHPYRVTGVIVSKGQDAFGSRDLDDRIVMPIGSARMRILHNVSDSVDFIVTSSASPQASERAYAQAEALLRQRHKSKGREADFAIYSQVRLMEVQNLVFDALSAFLACVAAVSLLVGGIGVMNIMLVSVTERTREIGIRLAIGASRADIRAQFLVEAAVLALLGGIFGTVVGLGGLAVFEAVLHWSLRLSVHALVAGIAVSVVTGVVFGFAPARRASLLDPIEALRHE